MNGVTYIAMPQEVWQSFLDERKRILETLERVEKKLSGNEEWIGTEEACRMLGITPRTWQNYRKKYNIRVSQVGRITRVLRSEVESLLKKKTL